VIHGIAELRQLCFRLFTSLAESHERIESLEDGLQHAKATAAGQARDSTETPLQTNEEETSSAEIARGSQNTDAREAITDTQLGVVRQQLLALCMKFRWVFWTVYLC
jgi:hypothetical protein